MNLQEHYRSLSGEETEILQSNGCKCSDWNRVKVRDGFNPAACINCIFSGDIRLGVYNDSYVDDSGVAIPSGLQNSRLHNCIVGSNVIINNTGDYIANYVIERMVDEYSASVASGRGAIRHHSRIFNCGTIRNVRVGPFSLLEGSMTLNEGSVNSTEADPVYIGSGVIMEHFIVCPGSVIRDSTLIDKCFIGQGCELSKHYSAENSLFFANSAGFHGEACSIFAGPYTVTHHKSTLLIAGIFSFMNAGSGSNQSNHMYKPGPIHQGIMERGSKTTGDSYLLWPARIGPFTLVMGRHYRNMYTSSLPFSYLIESNDESVLVPGKNLRSLGTIRDAQKRPLRDRRKGWL